MEAYGMYLIKASLYVVTFYAFYSLFLRRLTFFRLNRLFLLAGLILSVTLPLYTGFATSVSSIMPNTVLLEPMVMETEQLVVRSVQESFSFDVVILLWWMYGGVVTVRIMRLIASVNSLIRLRRKGVVSTLFGKEIIQAEVASAFTFFRWVFLPTKLESRAVVEHEWSHVKQHHWVVLLIAELVSIVLWVNPIMILYRKAIRQQHEYLADNAVLASGLKLEDYLASIGRQLGLTSFSSVVSGFGFVSVKNRINMMTTRRSASVRMTAYSLILPVIAAMMMSFSGNDSLVPDELNLDVASREWSWGVPIANGNEYEMHSGFGNRMHPYLKVVRFHTGLDFRALEGVPVVATESGEVVKAMLDGPWGNIVVIQHDEEYSSSYSHLKSFSVKPGDKVEKGQEIGKVGNTGISTGDHLHFELIRGGEAIDPEPLLARK